MTEEERRKEYYKAHKDEYLERNAVAQKCYVGKDGDKNLCRCCWCGRTVISNKKIMYCSVGCREAKTYWCVHNHKKVGWPFPQPVDWPCDYKEPREKAQSLREAMQELDELNARRRQLGLPLLTYGKWEQMKRHGRDVLK